MKLSKYFVLAILLSGCSIAPLNKQVQQLSPRDVTGKQTRSMSVTRVTNAVEVGHVVGKYYGGTLCLPHGNLSWRPSADALSEFSNATRKKLKENGYALLGDASSPFNDEFSKQAELLLGARIVGVDYNSCYSRMGAKGEIFMRIEWDLFDNKSNKIISTITTEGISSAPEFDSAGDLPLLKKAFAMAADNLLANKQFCDMLTIGPK